MLENPQPVSYEEWKNERERKIKSQEITSNLIDSQAMRLLLQFFSHTENIISNPRYYFRYLNERRR